MKRSYQNCRKLVNQWFSFLDPNLSFKHFKGELCLFCNKNGNPPAQPPIAVRFGKCLVTSCIALFTQGREREREAEMEKQRHTETERETETQRQRERERGGRERGGREKKKGNRKEVGGQNSMCEWIIHYSGSK